MRGPGPVERRLLDRMKRTPVCAALIDPEDFEADAAAQTAERAIRAGVGLLLVGGSTLANQSKLDDVVKTVKRVTRRVTTSRAASQRVPVVLFPGNISGVSRYADAILFSSLLNSTNPYFIVGAQALGAAEVYKAGIESIPMGYLVYGRESATSFIGQVNSIPTSKPELSMLYALAARYLGMRTLYLEGGSGTSEPVPSDVIRAVRKVYDGVLIIGGGITTAETAVKAAESGADIVVVGNMLQSDGYERKLRRITSALGQSAPHK